MIRTCSLLNLLQKKKRTCSLSPCDVKLIQGYTELSTLPETASICFVVSVCNRANEVFALCLFPRCAPLHCPLPPPFFPADFLFLLRAQYGGIVPREWQQVGDGEHAEAV